MPGNMLQTSKMHHSQHPLHSITMCAGQNPKAPGTSSTALETCNGLVARQHVLKPMRCAGMGLRLATYYRRANPSDTRHRELSANSTLLSS